MNAFWVNQQVEFYKDGHCRQGIVRQVLDQIVLVESNYKLWAFFTDEIFA